MLDGESPIVSVIIFAIDFRILIRFLSLSHINALLCEAIAATEIAPIENRNRFSI